MTKTIAGVLSKLRERYAKASEEMRALDRAGKEADYETARTRRWQLLKEISRIENGGVP